VHVEQDEQDRQLDRQVLHGSAWTAAGYGSRQVLAFASVLVLARLVEPHAFGLIALATPFLLALQYLQESGMSAALVHRRTDVERAAATLVVAAPLIGATLYIAVFFAAPTIADAFNAPKLALVLRIIGLMVVLRSLAIAPGALLERAMNFRARARVDIAAAVTQVSISIALAAFGAGVWALVAGQVAAQMTETVLYWSLTPFRPSPRDASWAMFRDMSRYSRFVGANNILNLFNNTVDNLIVGRLLGPTRLAYYALSFRLAMLPNSVIGYVVGRVMFSVYASLQHDRAAVKRVYLENLQRIAIFSLPVALTLVIAADPIVPGLLGERWSPAIAPLRLLGVYGLVRSFFAPSNEVFKGLGHPKYGLMAEIGFSLPVIPALLLLVPRLGLSGAPLAMLSGLALAGIPAFLLTLRLLDASVHELAECLLRPVAAAICVAGALLVAVRLTASLSPEPALLLVAAAGIVAYVGGTALFARRIVLTMWTNARGTT
jgi:PST family polysaccharide transporter